MLSNPCTGPEGSRQSAHEDSKVGSPTHWPSLLPRKYSWYSFLLEAESTPGPYCGRKDYVNDTFGNRTRDLPPWGSVPQPTAPPPTPVWSCKQQICRSQWLRGLRRGSAVSRLLGLWVRIPPEAWICVRSECCVFSGTDLCVGLITRLQDSYRVWCV